MKNISQKWRFTGAAVPSENYIQLTGTEKRKQGSVWTLQSTNTDHWEAEFYIGVCFPTFLLIFSSFILNFLYLF